MTTGARLARILGLVALTATLGACGGVKVRGMVLGGPIGRAMVVDGRDQRLADPGVEGVKIDLVHQGAQAGGGFAPIASAVSGPDGRFELTIPEADKVRGQLVVVADAANIFRTSTPIYVPRSGQELLVQVRERERSASADDSP